MDASQWWQSLVSGGVAGAAVDISLFPLDTVKTRLQSSQGFWKSGGFRHVYAGVGPAAVGSVPNAALFFVTYEAVKRDSEHAAAHMAAASSGEVVACLVRVPIEIVKQRRQANSLGSHVSGIVSAILKQEGFSGFYRGYLTTVLREIPFSLIQFPLWELLKRQWRERLNAGKPIQPWHSSLCGAAAGGVAASLTTPFDVAKTRIMLAPARSQMADRASVFYAMKVVASESGMKGLFAGVVPRTLWITLGGAIFFGAYETAKSLLAPSNL